MDRTRIAIAIVVALTGLVWIGQGLGYIGGSFMSSNRMWAFIGAAMVAAAVVLAASARRRE